jgi:hypothetical protein
MNVNHPALSSIAQFKVAFPTLSTALTHQQISEFIQLGKESPHMLHMPDWIYNLKPLRKQYFPYRSTQNVLADERFALIEILNGWMIGPVSVDQLQPYKDTFPLWRPYGDHAYIQPDQEKIYQDEVERGLTELVSKAPDLTKTKMKRPRNMEVWRYDENDTPYRSSVEGAVYQFGDVCLHRNRIRMMKDGAIFSGIIYAIGTVAEQKKLLRKVAELTDWSNFLEGEAITLQGLSHSALHILGLIVRCKCRNDLYKQFLNRRKA